VDECSVTLLYVIDVEAHAEMWRRDGGEMCKGPRGVHCCGPQQTWSVIPRVR